MSCPARALQMNTVSAPVLYFPSLDDAVCASELMKLLDDRWKVLEPCEPRTVAVRAAARGLSLREIAVLYLLRGRSFRYNCASNFATIELGTIAIDCFRVAFVIFILRHVIPPRKPHSYIWGGRFLDSPPVH